MGIKLSSITELLTGLSASHKIPYTTGSLTRLLRLDTLADWILQTYAGFTQSGSGAVSRTVSAKLQDVVSVLDFIPVAEHAAIKALTSTTNLATYVQAAVDSLSSTGGTIFFPTPGVYTINSQVDVDCVHPINLVSNMTGYSQTSPYGSCISVGATIAGSVFKYFSPTANRGDGGGGIVSGLAFRDLTGGSSAPGSNGVTAALELYDFNLSKVQNCEFHYISGSAWKTVFCVMSDFIGNVVRYCGDTSKPAAYVSPTDATYTTQSTNFVNNRFEVCHDAEYFKIEDLAHSNKISLCGFEADTAVAGSVQVLLSIASDRNTVSDCHFNRNGAAVQLVLASTASFNGISNCTFNGTANGTAAITHAGTDNSIVGCRHNSAKTGDEITDTGTALTIIGATLTSSGGITLSTQGKVVGSNFRNLTTTNAYWISVAADGEAIGCVLDGAGAGTNGGILLGSVTNAKAIGNTVKDMAGIGIRNQSAQGIVVGNSSYQNTGEDFSNTAVGAVVYGNWFQDQGASAGVPITAKLRYPTIPVGSVAYGSLGTSTTPVAGTIYWAEVWIDACKSLTGIGILNGATVGNDKHIVAIYRNDGTLLANSNTAGVTTSGADAFQEIAFTAATVVAPGRYWIALQMNGTTDRFRSIAASTFVDVKTKSAAGSFGTLTALTVPTTFTADVGPIAYAY
jgi:hypothetical protein